MQVRLSLMMVAMMMTVLRVAGHEEVAARPSAPQRAAVNFTHPLRDYDCRRISGWSVLMEEEMMKKDPEQTRSAVAKLEVKLNEIRQMLPSKVVLRLQKVPIFLLYGEKATGGGRSEGAQYFAQSAPKYNSNIDPRMGGSVVIYSAKHFCGMTEFGATKLLLHELSHAWHLEQWSENRSDIVSTYKNAMEKGLYHNVRKSDGSNLEEAYAATNHLEYFAELSCIWFYGSDHFPFDRGDLRLYDPVGFQLMQRLWSEPDASQAMAAR